MDNVIFVKVAFGDTMMNAGWRNLALWKNAKKGSNLLPLVCEYWWGMNTVRGDRNIVRRSRGFGSTLIPIECIQCAFLCSMNTTGS